MKHRYALKLLAGFINKSPRHRCDALERSTEKQRAAVTGRLAAELLIRLAFRTYEDTSRNGVRRRASAGVHRARSRSRPGERPDRADRPLASLLIASHDDESRATLAKLQRSPRAREPEIHSEIEELRQILDERAKSGVSQPSADAPRHPKPHSTAGCRRRG